MVKVARTYTIDEDLVGKLEEVNASGTINTLVRSYFEGELPDTLEELRLLYEENKAERAVFTKKMKHISDKINKIEREKEERFRKDMTEQQIFERKELVEEMTNKWREEKITDEEYWEFIDNK